MNTTRSFALNIFRFLKLSYSFVSFQRICYGFTLPFRESIERSYKTCNLQLWNFNRKHQLFEKGYSKKIIDSQIGKVKFGQRLKVGSKQAGVGVPFVITCHPKLQKMKNLPRTPIVSE